MAYKVVINTDAYKTMRASKKNWEPGTINDFMLSLNGWHTTEPNLEAVKWRLEWFTGKYSSTSYNNPKWLAWRNQKKNVFTYMDRLCGFERTQPLAVYGTAQGYIDIDKYIEELKKNKTVRIYFSDCYDIRQSLYKACKGCYMGITSTSVEKK